MSTTHTASRRIFFITCLIRWGNYVFSCICLSVYLLSRYLKNGLLGHYQTFMILLLGQWHKLVTLWWSCDQKPPINYQNTKMYISQKPIEVLTWNWVCSYSKYFPTPINYKLIRFCRSCVQTPLHNCQNTKKSILRYWLEICNAALGI